MMLLWPQRLGLLLVVLGVAWIMGRFWIKHWWDFYCQVRSRPFQKRLSQAFRQSWLGWIMALWAWVLATFALSWPYTNEGTKPLVSEGSSRPVFFLVDVSRSMEAADLLPNRIGAVTRWLTQARLALKDARTGLVVFAGQAYLVCPLTEDETIFLDYVNILSPSMVSDQGTNVEAAFAVLAQHLEKIQLKETPVVVLLTDGEDWEDSSVDRIQSLIPAMDLIVIGVGTPEGAPLPLWDGAGYQKDAQGREIITRLDESFLKRLAAQTGGQYFRLNVQNDQIIQSLVQKAQSPAPVKIGHSRQSYPSQRPAYQFLFVLAVLFTLMAWRFWSKPIRASLLGMLFLSHCQNQVTCLWPSQLLYRFERSQASYRWLSHCTHWGALEARWHLWLGLAALKINHPSACRAFDVAAHLAADPETQHAAWFNLGLCYHRLNQRVAALEAYEKALYLKPQDSWAKINIELLYQSQSSQNSNSDDSSQQSGESPEPESFQEKDPAYNPQYRDQISQKDMELIFQELHQQDQNIRQQFHQQKGRSSKRKKDW